jgi:MinD superfamily P-loop ATPase
MKICILNGSGKIGKSSIAREVFYTNMEDCILYEIESNNSGSDKFNLDNYFKIAASGFDEDIYSDLLKMIWYKH